jgi:glycosyltransferase involved in cell wall biosynthesis
MPTFNQSSYIKESLDSILNQSYKDFELIVVPVMEDRRTIEVIKSCSDNSIKIICSNYALVSHQMNVGYYHVSEKSDYMMLFASDDVMLEGVLGSIYNYAIANNAVVVYPDYYFVDKHLHNRRLFDCGNHSHSRLVESCYITDISLVKRDAFSKYLPMKFLNGHDRIWSIWKDLSKAYGKYFLHYNKPFFLYRQHMKNVHTMQKSQNDYKPLVIGHNSQISSFYKTLRRSDKIKFSNPTIYFPDPLSFINFDYSQLKYKRLIIHWTDNFLEAIPQFTPYRNLYHISHSKEIICLLLKNGLSI